MESIQALIPVFTSRLQEEDCQMVDARTLHSFLKVDARFNDWITRRIDEYCFIDGADFYSNLSKKAKGRPSTEYHLSLDMAKELSMVERNEKGRLARQYFIQCEKKLRHIAPQEANSILSSTIGTDGFHCLAAVLDGKLRHLPTKARQRAKMHVWSQVHKAFSVVSAEDIPATQLDSARNFIAAYNVHEGEFLGKEPEPKDEDSLILNGNEVTSLYKLMSHYSNACDIIKCSNLSGVAKAMESKPLFNLCEQISEAGFNFALLDKRRNEIYDIYKRRVSAGGYAMSKEGLPPR